jgi:hypothetical protein
MSLMVCQSMWINIQGSKEAKPGFCTPLELLEPYSIFHSHILICICVESRLAGIETAMAGLLDESSASWPNIGLFSSHTI